MQFHATCEEEAPAAPAEQEEQSVPQPPHNQWAHFGVREMPGNRYVDSTSDLLLGRITFMGEGGTKAECKQHKKCFCFLNQKVPMAQTVNELVEWFSLRVSFADHKVAATALKRRCGMTVRNT